MSQQPPKPGWLLRIGIPLYLNRDRLRFAWGLLRVVVGGVGVWLGSMGRDSDVTQYYWLSIWAMIVGGIVAGLGLNGVSGGWNDPQVEKERRAFREIQNRT